MAKIILGFSMSQTQTGQAVASHINDCSNQDHSHFFIGYKITVLYNKIQINKAKWWILQTNYSKHVGLPSKKKCITWILICKFLSNS
jgi:hypothetical protein